MSRTIKEWQERIHQYAQDKGWWSSERSVGDIMTNIHSELSEAWEVHRAGLVPRSDVYYYDEGHEFTTRPLSNTKPDGFWVEMADAVIRILDFAESEGVDLEEMMELKHAYNLTRPYRHGGKTA